METTENFSIALLHSKDISAALAETVGTSVLDIPSSSSTDFIPDWCKKIYNEDQEDPDKDPGFEVRIKIYNTSDEVVVDHVFMYVGQDTEQIKGTVQGSGKIHRGTAEWKNNNVPVTIDEINYSIFYKGDHYLLTIQNLFMLKGYLS